MFSGVHVYIAGMYDMYGVALQIAVMVNLIF